MTVIFEDPFDISVPLHLSDLTNVIMTRNIKGLFIGRTLSCGVFGKGEGYKTYVLITRTPEKTFLFNIYKS
jgi:hypothetical protein